MESGPVFAGYRAPNPCLSSDERARALNEDLSTLSGAELDLERRRLLDAIGAYCEGCAVYRVYLGSLPGIPFDSWARSRIARIGIALKSRVGRSR